jgi:hypothetical protein
MNQQTSLIGHASIAGSASCQCPVISFEHWAGCITSTASVARCAFPECHLHSHSQWCFDSFRRTKQIADRLSPIDLGDGREVPLCEADYFGRLNILYAKCGLALRGSYITDHNRPLSTRSPEKYNIGHFTCSVCPTLIGPQVSYYEHSDETYCHFHYSLRNVRRNVRDV